MKKQLIGVLGLLMAAAFATSAYAGTWVKDDTGWWYRDDNGGYPAGEWRWIDSDGNGTAECFYFYSDGYMAHNNEIDGSHVDDQGRWTVGGKVQHREVNSGSAADAGSQNGNAAQAALPQRGGIYQISYYFDALMFDMSQEDYAAMSWDKSKVPEKLKEGILTESWFIPQGETIAVQDLGDGSLLLNPSPYVANNEAHVWYPAGNGWYKAVVPYANTTATVSLVFTNDGSLYVCGSEGDVSDVYRKIQ